MTEKPRSTTDGEPPADGHWDAPAPNIGPDGQHGAYWILPPEERAKGFVRPVRTSYKHVGLPAPSNIRNLTDDEQVQHANQNYVKFEDYPPGEPYVVGRFWTQAQLDRVGAGCGSVTTVGMAIAETFSRDPKYYRATLCVHCNRHLSVNEFVWDGTDERVGS